MFYKFSGNEEYILEIVSRLLKILKTKNYLNTDNELNPLKKQDLRNITFFLVLNTNVSLKYDLSQDQNISHLLNTTPLLTKCILMSCVWGLGLEDFFYEIIAYTPSWFAFQLLDESITSLKFAKPYEVLKRVDSIIRAIYLNISRSDYRIMGNVDKKLLLGKFLDFTMELLRHFLTPDSEKFSDWSEWKFFEYHGFVIKHMLELILYCFQLYEHKPEFIVEKDYQKYSLMNEKDKLFNNHSSIYSEITKASLIKINNSLLNCLQTNVMGVSIKTFMYWVEIDLDDETTLQKSVGESAFKVFECLKFNENYEHDVVNQLESIVIRPTPLNDILKVATIGKILIKLENLPNDDNNRNLWMTEFISRGAMVLSNSECLACIADNYVYLNVENLKTIIFFTQNNELEEEEESKIKQIIFNSLENLTTDEIQEFILYNLNNFGQDFDDLDLGNFQNECTEMFNKTTSEENIDLKKYLILLTQNPQAFYCKLFIQTLKNDREFFNILEFYKSSKEISERFLEENLLKLIEENTSPNDIPKIISELYNAEIMDTTYFIKNILYQKVCESINSNDLPILLILIKSILKISQKHDLKNLTPPILVMAGQILDKYRWDLIKYTEMKEQTVVVTIELIQCLVKKFIASGEQNDKLWILSKIETFKPMTKYYFHKIALSREKGAVNFDEYLYPGGFNDVDKIKITSFLCEVCTFSIIYIIKSITVFMSVDLRNP